MRVAKSSRIEDQIASIQKDLIQLLAAEEKLVTVQAFGARKGFMPGSQKQPASLSGTEPHLPSKLCSQCQCTQSHSASLRGAEPWFLHISFYESLCSYMFGRELGCSVYKRRSFLTKFAGPVASYLTHFSICVNPCQIFLPTVVRDMSSEAQCLEYSQCPANIYGPLARWLRGNGY